MASESRTTWLRSIGTKGSSGWRSRANFWMRRTVSAPPVAAFSITSRPRRDHVDVAGAPRHELGVAEDGLEQVVEVVGDAARHLAESGEALGLVHLRLDLALRGHVAHDGEHARRCRRCVPGREERVTARFSERPSARLAVGIEGAHRILARERRPRGPVRLRGHEARRRAARSPGRRSGRRCARRPGSSCGSGPRRRPR